MKSCKETNDLQQTYNELEKLSNILEVTDKLTNSYTGDKEIDKLTQMYQENPKLAQKYYHELAHKYHPNKNMDSAKMKIINSTWENLSKYD